MNAQVEVKGVEELPPTPSTNNDNGNGDPEAKPDALPLFEVRIEGVGSLPIEAVSQAALVDYVTHLAYTESPTMFFPFRVEYLKVTGPDTPPEVARGNIYLDPTRIIIIGPERVPLAYVRPDPSYPSYNPKLSEESGPAEVMVVADEAVNGEGEDEK